jgi:hypothetical protein
VWQGLPAPGGLHLSLAAVLANIARLSEVAVARLPRKFVPVGARFARHFLGRIIHDFTRFIAYLAGTKLFSPLLR